MKTNASPKLRCSGCYFARKHSKLYVRCKLKARHKQRQGRN